MKKRTLQVIAIAFAIVSSFIWHSCQKEPDPTEKVEVSFKVLAKKMLKKSTLELKSIQAHDLSDADKVIITIQNDDGTPTDYTQHEMDVFTLGSDFITSKIALLTGDYKITEFYVLDAVDSIIFAAPLEGALMAQNVDDPLPILFTVTENVIQEVDVEVVSTENLEPEDFGLLGFLLTEVETFQFLISVSELGKAQLLTADLTISRDSYTYSQQLDAIVNNIVTIKDGFDAYVVSVSKAGYESFEDTLTNADLKGYTDLPLLIELTPSELADYVGTWSGDTIADTAEGYLYYNWEIFEITNTTFTYRSYVHVDTINETRIWEGWDADLSVTNDTMTVFLNSAGETRFDFVLIEWKPTVWYNADEPEFDTITENLGLSDENSMVGRYEFVDDTLRLYDFVTNSDDKFLTRIE